MDQPLKLPTRWSEQDRHQNLSVSPDGRDLTYHGWIFSFSCNTLRLNIGQVHLVMEIRMLQLLVRFTPYRPLVGFSILKLRFLEKNNRKRECNSV